MIYLRFQAFEYGIFKYFSNSWFIKNEKGMNSGLLPVHAHFFILKRKALFMNYRVNKSSRYFGNGHFSSSTINSSLSMCSLNSSRYGFTILS